MTNPSPLLEAKAIVKDFSSQRAVDGIDLTVNAGDAIFIVGPSGSGKSTLLRCLNLLEKPTSGTISFKGEMITTKKSSINRYREHVGMVFQHFNLFPHLTVLENITIAPIETRRLSAEDARSKALVLLERIGLLDKQDAYPHKLSGGQKQRIAIVRSLVMNPDVILFDEPTSALDPEMVGEVLALMKDLVKDNLTVVVVTHEINFAREVANRILFLDRGKVIADQSPEQFFSHAQDNPRITEFLSHIL